MRDDRLGHIHRPDHAFKLIVEVWSEIIAIVDGQCVKVNHFSNFRWHKAFDQLLNEFRLIKDFFVATVVLFAHASSHLNYLYFTTTHSIHSIYSFYTAVTERFTRYKKKEYERRHDHNPPDEWLWTKITAAALCDNTTLIISS